MAIRYNDEERRLSLSVRTCSEAEPRGDLRLSSAGSAGSLLGVLSMRMNRRPGWMKVDLMEVSARFSMMAVVGSALSRANRWADGSEDATLVEEIKSTLPLSEVIEGRG